MIQFIYKLSFLNLLTMEKSPVVELAKKICPAVITIIISKDLPKIEGFYFMPFEGENLVVPKLEEKGRKEKTKIGGGSGFITSQDGYVVTSQHVVADSEADYMVIVEPTKRYQAKVLSRDPIHDIAVLKISGKNLPYLEMGDSDKLEIGEQVIAVGNPLGEFHDTVSTGIISGLSRLITAFGAGTGESRLKGLIQTDAAINPGNSGGPLVNMDGQVIGINTAMVMGAQNLGFAIPINYAKKDLEEVKKFGKIKRPFLGIKYIVLNKELSKQNKLKVDYGALVIRERFGESAIVPGSCADKADIQEFDIVLEINKEKITEKNTLSDILQKFKIGDEISLKVKRGEKALMLTTILEEKK